MPGLRSETRSPKANDVCLEFYEDHVLPGVPPRRRRASGIPGCENTAPVIPICGSLCAITNARGDARPHVPPRVQLVLFIFFAEYMHARSYRYTWCDVRRRVWVTARSDAYIRAATFEMKSVSDMLRPLHFVSDPSQPLQRPRTPSDLSRHRSSMSASRVLALFPSRHRHPAIGGSDNWLVQLASRELDRLKNPLGIRWILTSV